jgi:hypothetical protein
MLFTDWVVVVVGVYMTILGTTLAGILLWIIWKMYEKDG